MVAPKHGHCYSVSSGEESASGAHPYEALGIPLEASALTHASRRGLLTRPSRLLRLQKDDRLVAMMRDGDERAFEVLFERYNARLLGFCQHMLTSREDAEDVLQEVFVAAHNAILADGRDLNVRPWLYRIARNRCLNHLRKPVADGQDTMDVHPHENGASTAERVQNREEFRRLVSDVQTLPETQRTALLLREVDAMSYEEIAEAMDTTVPAVKSLLVRARITLAESSQARLLTCGEVQLELAEATEGLTKASGPVRQHVKGCEQCKDFRDQLRSNSKALAALLPVGPLVLLKDAIVAKLGGAGAGSAGTSGAGAGGSAAAGGTAAGGATAGGGAAAGSAIGGAAAATGGGSALGSGLGAIGGIIGTKAVATAATAAVAVAGAVEVKNYVASEQPVEQGAIVAEAPASPEPKVVKAAEDASPIPVTLPTTEPSKPAESGPAPGPAQSVGAPPSPPADPAPAAEPPAPVEPVANTAENAPAAAAEPTTATTEIGTATAHDRPPATSGEV